MCFSISDVTHRGRDQVITAENKQPVVSQNTSQISPNCTPPVLIGVLQKIRLIWGSSTPDFDSSSLIMLMTRDKRDFDNKSILALVVWNTEFEIWKGFWNKPGSQCFIEMPSWRTLAIRRYFLSTYKKEGPASYIRGFDCSQVHIFSFIRGLA